MDTIKVTRALVSVSDKTGIEELAGALLRHGIEVLSTGGTAKLLSAAGLKVVQVGQYTGFPEILDGRVKTLHPRVHGGILARRDDSSHQEQLRQHGIAPIDLVVVNLYPFERVVRDGCTREEAIENIDIGGPTMVRAAAKNHRHVVVVVDPQDYPSIIEELRKNSGAIQVDTSARLARKAFLLTARYDGAIADYLGRMEALEETPFGPTLHFCFTKSQSLRYGENPHQRAAFYRAAEIEEPSVATARQIHGKELSFNNIMDANAALELVKEFRETAAVAIKHTNPCGAAISDVSLADAFKKARACDPVSIFGGIVGLNRPMDRATAEAMEDLFLEVVIAPSFEPAALELYRSNKRLKNVRLLSLDLPPGQDLFTLCAARRDAGMDIRGVVGGVLIQDRDLATCSASQCEVVTERKPTPMEMAALDFAWRVCKHVKSNAIVFAAPDHVVGVGAGQMSRVDAARLAVMRAVNNKLETKGTAVASDAFFPFRDGIDVIAEAGATAVAQPGGSVRDREVIDAANEHGIAMIFTRERHFRHA